MVHAQRHPEAIAQWSERTSSYSHQPRCKPRSAAAAKSIPLGLASATEPAGDAWSEPWKIGTAALGEFMSSEEMPLDDSVARRRIVFDASGEASLSVELSCAVRAVFCFLRAAAAPFRSAVANRRGSVAS